MKASIQVSMACLALATCANSDRMTVQNPTGEVVVCKSPDAPAFSELGREALVTWCSNACEARGFKWTGKGQEEFPVIADLDLGKKERRAAEKYLPAQCLPY